jgi:TonB family protein
MIFFHHLIMKKRFTLLLLFIFPIYSAFAQQVISRIIVADTINIYGKVITENGNKIGYTTITSKSLDNTYYKYHIATTCDSLGNFKLSGIKSLDTLTINQEGNIQTVINHGSRHLTIKMPSQILHINWTEKPTVAAKRIVEKAKLKFNVDTSIIFICGFIETEPQYPGGKPKLNEYISRNLTYPIAAIQNNIEGTVTIEFKIWKDGTLTSPKIINGLGYGCDEVVLDIFKKSKKWIPGISIGRPFVSTLQMDIIFKLQDQ